MVFMPAALLRAVPTEPRPFSTPRAWASLSRALDSAEAAGILDDLDPARPRLRPVSPEDAAVFCVMAENRIEELRPVIDDLTIPRASPREDAARWFVLCRVREAATTGALDGVTPERIRAFLMALPREHRFALLVGTVEAWGRLGADDALRESLREVTGL